MSRRAERRTFTSTLAVRCWCQLHTVGVPAVEVRRGLTRPCSSPACVGVDRQARVADLERREELLRGRG